MLNTSRDIHYMKLAQAQAQLAYEQEEVPVGAVLVADDQIIAQAYNQVQQQADATAHAELQVLKEGCKKKQSKYLVDCTLYVTLEPCTMCAAACYWTQVQRLVFSASDPKRGYRLFEPCILHPKTKMVWGVMPEESSKLIKLFFKQLRLSKTA